VESPSANHARLGSISCPLVRAKLRAWLALEDLYSQIIEAAAGGNREKFVSSVYSYVSAATFVSREEMQAQPWYEVVRALKQIYRINMPTIDFPVLHDVEKKEGKIEWDYVGRDWYNWLNLLAGKYGWEIEYIANLDVDDGIGLLQEILLDKQLQKEFQWSMSEVAYSYNNTTKITKFIPLERPEWMKPKQKPVKKIKIKVSELPIGLVLKWNTDTNEYTRPQ
jgi:hypothetical protein